ncbi:MAG: T9SS type A sorting domain-containing protein [Chitinophagales bacterium]
MGTGYCVYDSCAVTKEFYEYGADTVISTGLTSEKFARSFEVFPNPFSSSATISFSLEEKAQTTVSILDLTGRKIKTLIDENLAAGDYRKLVNCESIGAGVYLLNVKVNGETFSKKISIE